jgi:hypothetical protein
MVGDHADRDAGQPTLKTRIAETRAREKKVARAWTC